MSLDKNSFLGELARVFSLNGLSGLLTAKKSEALFLMTERMLEENEKYNLTAITEPDKIILNHYADCAVLAKILPSGARVADVGCGAGFPTLPIAILRPDVKILGIDSTAKRITYVNMAAEKLGLSNVCARAARAEDVGKSEFRESFDIVTARAVANMRVLAELCIPLVKPHGKMIAMKGKNAEFELAEAKRAIATLGGKLSSVEEVTLRSDEEELSHPLIIIDKISKTPAAYPRPFAQISKKPL
jgi:16S rRNA (guanine(527)-N(7))-methyltransferase RsmG